MGVVVGGAVFIGLTYNASTSARTAADLRAAHEVNRWAAILVALSILALGVLIDSRLFERRGRPVEGLSSNRSGRHRVVAAVFWPGLVAGVLIVGLPLYCYLRAKAAAKLRGVDEPSRSPTAGLLAGFAGALIWAVATVTVMYGGASRLTPKSFVADEATEHEAADWALAQGRTVVVFCDRTSVLRVGESLTCLGYDSGSRADVRLVGTVVDDSGRTEWRFDV